MPQFPSMRARDLLKILEGPALGYSVARQRGSHRQLVSAERPPMTFAFGDNEMLGGAMVKKVLTKGARLTEDEAMGVL